MDDTLYILADFPWAAIIIVAGVLIAINKFKANNFKKFKGTPYPALELEWPAAYSGKILFNNDVLFEYDAATKQFSPETEQKIVMSRQSYKEIDVLLALPERTYDQHKQLNFDISYEQTDNSPPRNAEIELVIAWMDGDRLEQKTELEEQDIFFDNSGQITQKFIRFHKRYQNIIKKWNPAR